MKDWFEKLSKNNKLLSILMLALGLAMVIWPDKSLEWIGRILGIALLLGGAVSALSWYRDRHKLSTSAVTLAIAIVCLVLGVIVLAAPKGFLDLLPKLVGLAVALNGVLNIAQAMDQRRAGYVKWLVSLALGILTIIAGAIIFFNAFDIMRAAMVVIGIVMIYNGASNLWIESRYRKI